MSRVTEIFSAAALERFQESLSAAACHSIETMPPRPIPLPKGTSESMLDLNGNWKVLRWPFSAEESAVVADPDSVIGLQDVIAPGKVLYQDPEDAPFGKPSWNRVTMAHLDENDGAILVRKVRIPSRWSSKRILWHCDGVYPAGRFFINGVEVGTHLSGLTAAQYDITDLVTPGEEVILAIRLIRRYHASHIDMPRHSMEFAGLTRNTALYAIAACHITEWFMPSSVDPQTRKGALQGNIALTNITTAQATASVSCRLLSGDGDAVVATWTGAPVIVPAFGAVTVFAHLEVLDVKLWNDEYPNLYRLVVEVVTAAGAEPMRYERAVGFRHFEIRQGGPFLNGNPVKFRGVNHVTFHPDHGMHTPREWLRKNFELMKKANVNCIRTHFAAQPDVTELADEMGFYLFQEIPIDWWGDYVDKPDLLHYILHRIEGVVIRDRHHPCVIGFCMGNENFPTNPGTIDAFTRHYDLYRRYTHALSPEALVLVPPPGPANRLPGHFEPRFGDIADVHYNIESIRKYHRTDEAELYRCWGGPTDMFTKEELTTMGWNGVWFSSEYCLFNNIPDLLNAPYCSVITEEPEDWLSGKNSLQVWIERMEREWGYMYSDPTCLGGAYFPWLAPSSGSHFGWSLLGEDADWGIVTTDLLPKPAYWALRTLFSPVRFPGRLTVGEDDESIAFTVTNHFNAIDLSSCVLRTQMGPTQKDLGLLREWQDITVSCAPGATVTIQLPLWHDGARRSLREGKISLIRCHLIRPDGFRVTTADILLVPTKIAAVMGQGISIGSDAV